MYGMVHALKRQIQGTIIKLQFMEITAAMMVTNW